MGVVLIERSTSWTLSLLSDKNRVIVADALASSLWQGGIPPLDTSNILYEEFAREIRQVVFSGPLRGITLFESGNGKTFDMTGAIPCCAPTEKSLGDILFLGSLLFAREMRRINGREIPAAAINSLTLFREAYTESLMTFINACRDHARETAPLYKTLPHGRSRITSYYITDDAAAAMDIINTLPLGPLTLPHTIIADADLRGACLAGSDFSSATFKHVNLAGANLAGAVCTDTHFERCDLGGAVLAGAVFGGATFVGMHPPSTLLR